MEQLAAQVHLLASRIDKLARRRLLGLHHFQIVIVDYPWRL